VKKTLVIVVAVLFGCALIIAKDVSILTDASPAKYAEGSIPSSWGRLVAAFPSDIQNPSPSLLFEAQDGTIRRVWLSGGELYLMQTIKRR